MKKLVSLALTVAVFTALTTLGCTPVIAQQAIDPATSPITTVDVNLTTLIGSYDGEWKYQHFSDRAKLKITRIQDGYLVGEIYYSGRGMTAGRWWKFTDGRLEGMALIFNAGSGGSYVFTVTPNKPLELKGSSTGLAVNAEFEFSKNNN